MNIKYIFKYLYKICYLKLPFVHFEINYNLIMKKDDIIDIENKNV